MAQRDRWHVSLSLLSIFNPFKQLLLVIFLHYLSLLPEMKFIYIYIYFTFMGPVHLETSVKGRRFKLLSPR